MVAADDKLFVITRQGSLYCFGGKPTRPRTYDLVRANRPSVNTNDEWKTRAGDILQQTGVMEGYCLVLGVSEGRLIEELVRQSELHIVAFDPDTGECVKDEKEWLGFLEAVKSVAKRQK